MSIPKLQKIPTDWLDCNDSKAEKIAAELSSREFSGDSNPTSDWEVIGISSGDASPQLPRDQSMNTRCFSRAGSRQIHPMATSLMEDDECSRQEGGFVVNLCGVKHRIFAPVGFSELGSGRFVGTRILIVIRLLFLFMLGVSAGFSYALRDQVPVSFLLSELFIWLFFTLLFLIPSLLLSSILTLRWHFLRDTQGEDDPSKQRNGAWLITEILYQVVLVLAQTELARLLVMSSVPSLRPVVDHEGAELLFSLGNPFAAQRYLMVACTVIDSVLSTVPMRMENSILALLVFVPCTSASLFSYPTQSPTAVKIGYLFGFSTLVVVLTWVNVLVHRALSPKCRKEQIEDRPKTTVDMV